MPERTPNRPPPDDMPPPFFRLFPPDDEERKQVMRGARTLRAQAARARRRGVTMEFDENMQATCVTARLSDGSLYWQGWCPLRYWPPERLQRTKDRLEQEMAREEGAERKVELLR
jgi:hypothetical protein